jgi:hypothetical protein
MKHKLIIAVVALLSVLTTVTVFAQSGGTYDLSWSRVSGGGGELVGGNYTMHGALGQPEASTLSGGNYTLSGGFLVGGGTASFKVYLPTLLK